jgi:MFS family permease
MLEEFGLISLYHASRDVKLLCAQRFVRLLAYGASTLVLVMYLEALHISKTQTGLFMTLTIVGDVCISFLLTLFADGIGRKAILALGSLLMTASGLVFANSGNYWVLLVAAVLGVISPRSVFNLSPSQTVAATCAPVDARKLPKRESRSRQIRRFADSSVGE